jgi:hypothetical protein
MVVPVNNTHVTTWFAGDHALQRLMEVLDGGESAAGPWENDLGREAGEVIRTVELRPCPWLATMSQAREAGFYAHLWGRLPFTFGPVPPEVYHVVRLTRGLRGKENPDLEWLGSSGPAKHGGTGVSPVPP